MFEILRYSIQKLSIPLKDKLKQFDVTVPYVIATAVALIFVLLGINVFIELTKNLQTDVLASYDQQIAQSIISYRSPVLTNYFVIVTKLGNASSYLIIISLFAFVSFIIFKKWKYMSQITLVLLLAALSNSVLKRFINRARPDIEHLVAVKTLSYPSGHAMASMAFYGFLAYLFYKFNLPKYIKVLTILVLALLILSIGISRIYLGVHFPSDIAGGFIAGAIWVLLCIVVFNVIEVFKRDPKT